MNTLVIHPADNVAVALTDLRKGEMIGSNGTSCELVTNIPAKHKFALRDFAPEEEIIMYGVLVGKAVQPIKKGELITTTNIKHATNEYALHEQKATWKAPDVSKWKNKTFKGYHRADGSVGTANHWIVVPLVFCENINVEVLREAFLKALGYQPAQSSYQTLVQQYVQLYKEGKANVQTFSNAHVEERTNKEKVFPNVDGIKFLTHTMGCGGTRQDARALCGLLAGYITHPNVAGATVLSLGCQNAQVTLLQEELQKRIPNLQKPVIVLEQQQLGSEIKLLEEAIRQTFLGLIEANKIERKPAPLNKLCIGLE